MFWTLLNPFVTTCQYTEIFLLEIAALSIQILDLTDDVLMYLPVTSVHMYSVVPKISFFFKLILGFNAIIFLVAKWLTLVLRLVKYSVFSFFTEKNNWFSNYLSA